MIKAQHCIIRSADPDDASALKAVYDDQQLRSALLDQKREFNSPTLDELREVMSKKEMGKAIFYTVEDLDGRIRGFCSLRGFNPEVQFGEIVVIFECRQIYATPLAAEVLDFLFRLSFQRMRIHKVLAHCLDCEHEYREFLIKNGFESAGVQRDVLFARGRWFNLEALTLMRADWQNDA